MLLAIVCAVFGRRMSGTRRLWSPARTLGAASTACTFMWTIRWCRASSCQTFVIGFDLITQLSFVFLTIRTLGSAVWLAAGAAAVWWQCGGSALAVRGTQVRSGQSGDTFQNTIGRVRRQNKGFGMRPSAVTCPHTLGGAVHGQEPKTPECNFTDFHDCAA